MNHLSENANQGRTFEMNSFLNQLMEEREATGEVRLSDNEIGYALLDAMVQANIDLRSVSLEEMKSLLVAFSTRATSVCV